MAEKLTEICRSFGYKLNVGNFMSRDFFCSQKMEVPEDEAEETSKRLWHFCKLMVEKDVAEYIEAHKPAEEQIIDETPAKELGIEL
jgi:hypothetical protein